MEQLEHPIYKTFLQKTLAFHSIKCYNIYKP
nr:MAG TPA: hypothetical protein [Caudoviricetes sp.]